MSTANIVYIIISKYQEDSHTRTLKALNDIVDKNKKDIKLLIGKWFSALEDEGVNPWLDKECMEMANKHVKRCSTFLASGNFQIKTK